jgi:hypothetical protein
MGRNGYSRRDAAQPAAHGSTRRPRGDGRLDPVRWRRPGRGTLLRLAAVAALLATAAAVLWSPPKGSCDTGAVTPAASGATKRPGAAGAGNGAAEAGNGAAEAGNGAAGADKGTAGDADNDASRTGDTGPVPAGGDDAARAGDAAGPAVPEGSVGVPIRLADPTALGLVRPGNRVDLLRVDDTGGRPTAVAGSALVLRVTGVNDPATGGLLLALTPQEASQAVATSRQGFAIVIRPD